MAGKIVLFQSLNFLFENYENLGYGFYFYRFEKENVNTILLALYVLGHYFPLRNSSYNLCDFYHLLRHNWMEKYTTNHLLCLLCKKNHYEYSSIITSKSHTSTHRRWIGRVWFEDWVPHVCTCLTVCIRTFN